ncbi:MAG TPA: DUF2188 domain-containing protein [Planctomycetota bacterium]|nr:DUF2188 domain-containing protein [Planctomycetota bacterium]
MKDLVVQPRPDGRWELRRKGAARASSLHDNQTQATAAGKRRAKADGVDLVVKDEKGKIRSKDSYGGDPPSRKDTEH